MDTLREMTSGLPAGLSEEKPGSNLASLAMTPPLRQIIDTVLVQWRSQETFKPLAKYGIFPVRQLLFYGPPGNGKTSACSWIAKQLDVPLFRVRCEQLVEAYLGRTATNVSKVMEHLMKSPSAVVLFDEVETLFPARGKDGSACGREMTSAMTVYWQYMDRWAKNHLFVLATNMHDQLDAALMSRIEMHLEFGPPTTEQSRQVIAYWAETLHNYGGARWSAELYETLEQGESFESFRFLWQQIQRHVNRHVVESIGGR
jgi:ATP-dependent 26S proteasome regulatory subunit